jgi:hypothetical protein
VVEKIYAYKISVGKPEGKIPHVYGRITLRWILSKE